MTHHQDAAAAAGAAVAPPWRRLGSAFLGSRADHPREPWALVAFGPPR
ncbi:MAG: hypothetical protein PGN23_15475 [Sphingomonas adhaesiva]